MRKITAFLPADMLETAQAVSGANLTETLRQALEAYNHAAWCERGLALAGKVDIDLNLDLLREDRTFDDRGLA